MRKFLIALLSFSTVSIWAIVITIMVTVDTGTDEAGQQPTSLTVEPIEKEIIVLKNLRPNDQIVTEVNNENKSPIHLDDIVSTEENDKVSIDIVLAALNENEHSE